MDLWFEPSVMKMKGAEILRRVAFKLLPANTKKKIDEQGGCVSKKVLFLNKRQCFGNFLALLVGMQIDIATMDNTMEYTQKKILGIKLPYDLTIPLLGICSEETITEKDTCTPMFIVALYC